MTPRDRDNPNPLLAVLEAQIARYRADPLRVAEITHARTVARGLAQWAGEECDHDRFDEAESILGASLRWHRFADSLEAAT